MKSDGELEKLLDKWKDTMKGLADGAVPAVPQATEPYAERYEDMSPDGRLRVHIEDDGDAIVVIVPPMESGKPVAEVQFCTFAGGGQSPHTREAILNLKKAMERDNAERKQHRE